MFLILLQKCDRDVNCGYGKCQPALLQRCNNPRALLMCLALFNFGQGRSD